MSWRAMRLVWVPLLNVAILFGWVPEAGIAQTPTAPGAGNLERLTERDRLHKQVDELRRTGKLDEAVPLAERLLGLERRSGDGIAVGVAEALSLLAELHELQGQWDQAVERSKEALGVREQVDGKDHWRTADARLACRVAERMAGRDQANQDKVASALRKEQEAIRLDAQGKYAEAERVARLALEAYKVELGPETAEVARVWHAIGRARLGRNDGPEGKAANERALAIRRRILPANHPDIGRSLNNLSLAERILGNHRQSRELLEEAIKLWRASLGPSDPLVVMGLTNLAATHEALGDHAAALKNHEEALGLRRKTLPKDHPDIALSLNNLAVVQNASGLYSAAKKSHDEALAIRRNALSPEHPDIIQSLENLVVVQKNLRDYVAARKNAEDVVALRRMAIPRDDLQVAFALIALGNVQNDQRDFVAAKASHSEALAICRKSRPRDHVDIAVCLHNLGIAQRGLGGLTASKACHEESLAIERKVSPANHPNLASSLYCLGLVQHDMKDYAAARKSYKEALTFYRKALPAGHLDIALCLDNLGNVQDAQEDYAAAKASHEEALAIRRKALPNHHPDIATSLAGLGYSQGGLHDDQGAQRSYKEALAIRRKALPTDDPLIANTLFNLGNAQLGLRDFAAAKGNYEEAVAIRRRLPSTPPSELANCLNNLGNAQRSLGDFRGAKASHEEALAIRRKALPADHPDLVQSMTNLGALHGDLHDYAAARKAYEEALGIRRKALPIDHEQIASCLSSLGNILNQQGDLLAARGFYEEAVGLYRKASPRNQQGLAASLIGLSGVLMKLERFGEAKSTAEEALALAGKDPQTNPLVKGLCLYMLGMLELMNGDAVAGKRKLDEGLSLCRKAGFLGDSFFAMETMGSMLHDMTQGNFSEARKKLEGVLQQQRKNLPKNHQDLAESLSLLSTCAVLEGDFVRARAALEELLSIQRQALSKDHPKLAKTLCELGQLLRMLGDRTSGREFLEEALAIRRKALPINHPDLAESLSDLASLRADQGDIKGCIALLEESLSVRRNILPRDDAELAKTLENLGRRRASVGEDANAKVYLEEAVALGRRVKGEGLLAWKTRMALYTSLLSLSRVHSKLGEKDASIRCLEEAVAVQHQMPKWSLAGISFTLLTVKEQAMIDLDRGDQARGIHALERVLHDFGEYLERSALAQSESEQLRFTAEMSSSAYAVMLGLLQLKEFDRAYAVLLNWKGAVTARQRWARLTRNPDDPRTAELIRELRAVDQQLLNLGMTNSIGTKAVSVDAAIQSLSARREKLERDLTSTSVAYRKEKQRSQRVPADIIAALSPEVALIDVIEYFSFGEDKSTAKSNAPGKTDRRLGAFVLNKEGSVQWVDLGPSATLSALIDRWRNSYGAGRAPEHGQPDPGMELRKLVWTSLEPHLKGKRIVLVSPDGPINGLPIAALPGSKEGTFLVNEYAFAVVPVAQLLPETMQVDAQRKDEPPRLLLVGAIDFGDKGSQKVRNTKAPTSDMPSVPVYGPLPGAESEVNDLRTQFEDRFPDAQAPRLMRKGNATKQAVETALPSHRFAHLATHGFFAEESEESAIDVALRASQSRAGPRLEAAATGRHPGLLSGVVFAGVNLIEHPPKETILTALEAAELHLDNVELVTLSACETGRGRVAGGEGMLGLQRALQIAGARSVVASLWKVPDEETHQLMREFYRRVWSENHVSKAEALRQAQLWMLENWKPRRTLERPVPQGPPSPYYWAAFVLSGDWR